MHTVSTLAKACKGFMVKPPKGRDMIPSDGYAMGVFTSNGFGTVMDGVMAVRAPVACQEDGWWSPDGRRIRDGVDPIMAGLDPLFEVGARWRHTVSVRRADLRAFCEAVVKLAQRHAHQHQLYYLITLILATGEIRYSMAPYTLVQHVQGLAFPPSAGIEPFTVTLDARRILLALAPLEGSVVRMEFTKHQLDPVVFRGDALTCAIVAAVRV